MSKLTLSHATIRHLRDEARAAPDVEVCGLIGRTADGRDTVYPTANVHTAPAHAFEISPRDQIRALKLMRQTGAQLLAIYHSHPAGPAVPSKADRSGIGYPKAYTLIIAPQAPRGWQIRSWHLSDDGFSEISLSVCR